MVSRFSWVVIVANSSCSWLSRQLWEAINLLVFERKYLYRNFGEMHYVHKCGFHEFLMLHCSIFCLSMSTFYGKAWWNWGICWDFKLKCWEMSCHKIWPVDSWEGIREISSLEVLKSVCCKSHKIARIRNWLCFIQCIFTLMSLILINWTCIDVVGVFSCQVTLLFLEAWSSRNSWNRETEICISLPKSSRNFDAELVAAFSILGWWGEMQARDVEDDLNPNRIRLCPLESSWASLCLCFVLYLWANFLHDGSGGTRCSSGIALAL